MKRIISRVKLFSNENDKSKSIKDKVEKLLKKYKFEVVDEDFDLAISIGGDGSFLRMMKQTEFNSSIYYIGINSGTLGFLQEIKPSEIELFIARLANNDFKIEEIGIEQTTVTTKKEELSFYSLNDIVIRDKEFNTVKLSVEIDNNLLEHFSGDGLLISTSIGSTAYNLSFGGSVVYASIHTLQITPIAPLNSKVYHSLVNSIIIPEDKIITIKPLTNKNIFICIDGTNKMFNNVVSITTRVGDKKIYCLRMNEYNYTNIINDKFLSIS